MCYGNPCKLSKTANIFPFILDPEWGGQTTAFGGAREGLNCHTPTTTEGVGLQNI